MQRRMGPWQIRFESKEIGFPAFRPREKTSMYSETWLLSWPFYFLARLCCKEPFSGLQRHSLFDHGAWMTFEFSRWRGVRRSRVANDRREGGRKGRTRGLGNKSFLCFLSVVFAGKMSLQVSTIQRKITEFFVVLNLLIGSFGSLDIYKTFSHIWTVNVVIKTQKFPSLPLLFVLCALDPKVHPYQVQCSQTLI